MSAEVLDTVVESYARSGALCTRATSALERARGLAARATTLQVGAAESRRHATALRRLGAKRRALAARAIAVVPRTSGRVVRRPVRRTRAVASSEALPREHVGPTARRSTWAHAKVYAMRMIYAEEVGGLPDRASATDIARRTWTVREIDTTAMPGARGPRCLVFEDHNVVRRVWEYPADWTTLSATALLRLADLMP